MKKLLLAALLISTTPAFASGKLIAQAFKSAPKEDFRLPSLIGLSIYDKIEGNVYYENFTSFSNATIEDFAVNSKNLNTKHMVHVHLGNLIVGGGIQAVAYLNDSSDSDLRVIAQASMKLW